MHRRHSVKLTRALAASALLAMAVAPSAPTAAADARMFVKARPMPAADPWSGFYAGAHGGYGWSQSRLVNAFAAPGEIDADPMLRGGLGGFQAGYNFRTDWLVVGVEGEFTWSDLRQNNFSCFTFGDQVCSAKSEWFAAVTARIGAAYGAALLYVKGGPAWVRNSFTSLATCAGTQPIALNGVVAACDDMHYASQTRSGWTVGGGLEYLIARNWSLKLEYSYMDFGTRRVTFSDGGGGEFGEDIRQTVNVVKAGFNYYFGAAGPGGGGELASPFAARNGNGRPSRVTTFVGFDFGKSSYGGMIGAMIAPNRDMDSSGLRIFMLGEAGHYKYPDDAGPIRGTYTGGDLLVGYAFEGDNYSINLLAGGNVTNHMLNDIDTANSVQGTAFGGKVRADAWINPTPATLVYGEADYSTAFRTYYAKAKVGYDITRARRVFIGPEVAALGNERFDQWRVGGHITQMTVGRVQMDISAGYAHDSVVGNAAYGGVEFSTSF